MLLSNKNIVDAVREYRTFRDDASPLFLKSGILDISKLMSTLEIAQSQTAKPPAGSGDSTQAKEEQEAKEKQAKGEVEEIKNNLESAYAMMLNVATSAGILAEKGKIGKKSLYARLAFALSGGFALVVPMLIMVLHPTMLTRLLVTSCSVLAVAVSLAIAMSTAEPKDIIACTAAYSAVLVVFVGVGGG